MSDLLTITDEALEKVLEVRSSEPDGDALALWVEISGQQAGAYTYLMEFRPKAELPADVVLDDSAGSHRGHPGRQRRQPPRRRPRLQRRDGHAEPEQARAAAVALRRRRPLGRARTAGHGGHRGAGESADRRARAVPARLAAIEGSIAYVELSGGCQGCGSAKATLQQGIEVIILDLVPEITEVVDVTDHTSGLNPYA